MSSVSSYSYSSNNKKRNNITTTTKTYVSHRKNTPEKIDPTLYCALSPLASRHLVVKPVSLNCLDYVCKDCITKSGFATLVCNNCGQKFRKTDLEETEESPLGKQLIKDNIDKLFSITLNQFEALKDNFSGKLSFIS